MCVHYLMHMLACKKHSSLMFIMHCACILYDALPKYAMRMRATLGVKINRHACIVLIMAGRPEEFVFSASIGRNDPIIVAKSWILAARIPSIESCTHIGLGRSVG